MGAARILLAEDDLSVRSLLRHRFERENFVVLEAADGPMALRVARDGVDFVVLDIGLPGIDGLEVVRRLRSEERAVPILLLTARCEEVDRIVGFEIGADDYLAKPFSVRELLARTKAILRRGHVITERPAVVLRFGRLEIDEAAREVRVDGHCLDLKPREFALLLAMAKSPGIALSRAALLERVWGYDFEGDERTVDVHVRRLRAKVEEQQKMERILHTVHGFGYKFRAPG